MALLQGEGINLKVAILLGSETMDEVHLNEIKITFGESFNQKKTLFTNDL